MTLDEKIKKIVLTWSFPTMQQKIKQVILEEIEKKKFIDDAYSGFYMVKVIDIRKILGKEGCKDK